MSLRENIIKFVKESWEKEGKKVSIRNIQMHFRLGSPTKIYSNFSGKAEIYRLARVPLDKDSIQKTKQAVKKKKEKTQKTDKIVGLELTPEQTKRLWAISHLEGGKDVSTIIDELLEADAVLRKHIINGKLMIPLDQVYYQESHGVITNLSTIVSKLSNAIIAYEEGFKKLIKHVNSEVENISEILYGRSCMNCGGDMLLVYQCRLCNQLQYVGKV